MTDLDLAQHGVEIPVKLEPLDKSPLYRVMVSGSRDFPDLDLVEGVLTKLHTKLATMMAPDDAVLIHGGARGVDSHANDVWLRLGGGVTVRHADWERWGASAGAIRNRELLEMNPDLVICFWDTTSPGTANAIRQAVSLGYAPILIIPRKYHD